MTQEEDTLRYDKMVENSLRNVVRQALEKIIETGSLPGNHHFYITFITDYEGVKVPKKLADRYPGEMTIVLQHQFDDLSVKNDILRVTLSFNAKPEKLVVPLAAITIFADPSVNFALQFQPVEDDGFDGDDDPEKILVDENTPDSDTDSEAPTTGEIVSLDQFRKKDK